MVDCGVIMHVVYLVFKNWMSEMKRKIKFEMLFVVTVWNESVYTVVVVVVAAVVVVVVRCG